MAKIRGIRVLFAAAILLLLAGGVARWPFHSDGGAALLWSVATVAGLVYATISSFVLLRLGRFSVDAIALLALVGTLLVGEPFAGAVITVMLFSGQLFESMANARAHRELSQLISRAPRTARRKTPNGITSIDADEVAIGDLLVVGSGEVLPVDGRLRTAAVLDESALTGEALPVEHGVGQEVRSGCVNAGQQLELFAIATAADSTYAGVVRLVEKATESSAPFVRVADRFAIFFVPTTLALAAAAWAISGDAVRAVAVLVVATPCPLLIAAPIAFVSGISRLARIGVIVKTGAVLEQLAAGRTVLFDKTGTLTHGRPELDRVITAAESIDADELLRCAAALDQVSSHVLASAIVTAAAERGLTLPTPTDVEEVHGHGLQGVVEGHRVRVGKAAWIVGSELPRWARQVLRRAELDGALAVFVAIEDEPAGAILLADPIRADAPRMIRVLRRAGLGRVVLLTGDRADIAEVVGRIVGVDAVLADCDPSDKLAAIERETQAAPTIMVGDGINDAPALAAAGAGVALASRGATASSESAGVVLTVDRIDVLAEAVLIARRTKRIALQAVTTGMTLSLLAMLVAAAGYLPPVSGALFQEGIDVLAIILALRAVLPREHQAPLSQEDLDIVLSLKGEHDAMRSTLEAIRSVADGLDDSAVDLTPVWQLLARIDNEVLPHERADEKQLLPLVAHALGGTETTAALSRTHAEIEHEARRLRRVLEGVSSAGLEPVDIVELHRILYGLYAILRLHNAQEDEGISSLMPTR